MAIESILRAIAGGEKNHVGDRWSLTYCSDAADEIERLRARVAELEKDATSLSQKDQHFLRRLITSRDCERAMISRTENAEAHWVQVNRREHLEILELAIKALMSGIGRQAIDAARKGAE